MSPIYKCLSATCNKAVDRPGLVCGQCARGGAAAPITISDNELRRFLLDPRNRIRVRDLMLSPGDDILLEAVAKGYNTSSKISVLRDVSVSSISLRLTDLRKRGYLTRVESPQESGGYEWVYTNVFKLEGRTDGQQP